jgi:hypothetical protein
MNCPQCGARIRPGTLKCFVCNTMLVGAVESVPASAMPSSVQTPDTAGETGQTPGATGSANQAPETPTSGSDLNRGLVG